MLCQKLDFVAEKYSNEFCCAITSNVSITIEKLISYKCDREITVDVSVVIDWP